MVSKLATVRTDDETWDSFQAKAKRNGTNASALLQRFVRDYLDDKLDSRIDSAAAPDVDIEAMINEAIASKTDEMRKEINDLKSTVNAVTKEFARYRDIEIDDLTARVVALETNRSEATAPANFTPALLQKAKAVAPLMLQKAA